MLSLSDIMKAAAEIAGQMTNIMGHVERNYASYDLMKARYRRNRLVGRLEKILQRLTSLRLSCHTTLYLTSKLAFDKGEESIAELASLDLESANFNLTGFLESLLEIRDIIDEYKNDIINTDYKLYENIEDCIKGRIRIVNILLENDKSKYSVEKLKSIYVTYENLISSLSSVKEELANKLKSSTTTEVRG